MRVQHVIINITSLILYSETGVSGFPFQVGRKGYAVAVAQAAHIIISLVSYSKKHFFHDAAKKGRPES